MEKSINVIQSIQRAINILNCFNQNELELSLNVISEKVKLNINTTRGLVNSLVANKLIYHNKKNNTYSIGDYFLIKSNLVLNNNMNRAKELSTDLLDLLSQKFNVSSRLQIITDDSIFTALTVDPQNSHYILTSTRSLNFPLHATSSGKLFLCYKKKDLSKIKLEKFTENTIINIEKLKEETKNNDKITLNIAFNYGSRAEIIDAVNDIIKDGKENISEEDFSKYLYNDFPDPDLLIRTSGEMRISNFLLWQIAYSELYITDTLWPDFDEKEIDKAIESYNQRDRRFGGVKNV